MGMTHILLAVFLNIFTLCLLSCILLCMYGQLRQFEHRIQQVHTHSETCFVTIKNVPTLMHAAESPDVLLSIAAGARQAG